MAMKSLCSIVILELLPHSVDKSKITSPSEPRGKQLLNGQAAYPQRASAICKLSTKCVKICWSAVISTMLLL